jgi:hypothetical protein
MFALPVETRDVAVDGIEAIRAFASADPFFTGPGGGQKVAYTWSKPIGNDRLLHAVTCQKQGNLYATTIRTQLRDASSQSEALTLLGGIALLQVDSSHGFLKSTHTEMVRLEQLQGQPFPLAAGKRFGYTAKYSSTGTYAGQSTQKMACAVTDVRVRSIGNLRLPEAAPQVICLLDLGPHQEISRYYLDEGSGCLLNVGAP